MQKHQPPYIHNIGDQTMPRGGWQEFTGPGGFSGQSRAMERPDVSQANPNEQQAVRVQRTRGGKRGKTVTQITGLALPATEAKALLKRLKARAGTGGTVKDDLLELQGDQVTLVMDFLQNEGFRPKQAGG